MGIVLLGMFIPIVALSVLSLIVSVRARRGKAKPETAWTFLILQTFGTFILFRAATGGDDYLREVWIFFTNFLLTGTLVCAVVMFTPGSKVLKKNR
jgi:hypothetical protein